ncbi:TPA: fimbrial protein [Serratia marcescens]
MSGFCFKQYRYVACLALCLLTSQAIAAGTVDYTINISAAVVIPPCIVNNNQEIDFVFGNVDVNDVNSDSNNAGRSIVKTVPVHCPPGIVNSSSLKVKVTGVTSGASNRLVTKESTGAGIGLYQGDVKMNQVALTVGNEIPLSGMGSVSGSYTNGYNGSLTFSGRVEKSNNSVNVMPGGFSATATMLVEQL